MTYFFDFHIYEVWYETDCNGKQCYTAIEIRKDEDNKLKYKLIIVKIDESNRNKIRIFILI